MQLRMKYYSDKYGKNISKLVAISDCKGLHMSLDFDIIRYCRGIVSIDQNHYPEMLKNHFVINSPWYIQGIFSLIKPWIDPITREKFIFLGEDYLETLKKYINESNIPILYGGTDDTVPWCGPWAEKSGCSDEQILAYLNSKNSKLFSNEPVLPSTESQLLQHHVDDFKIDSMQIKDADGTIDISKVVITDTDTSEKLIK